MCVCVCAYMSVSVFAAREHSGIVLIDPVGLLKILYIVFSTDVKVCHFTLGDNVQGGNLTLIGMASKVIRMVIGNHIPVNIQSLTEDCHIDRARQS